MVIGFLLQRKTPPVKDQSERKIATDKAGLTQSAARFMEILPLFPAFFKGLFHQKSALCLAFSVSFTGGTVPALATPLLIPGLRTIAGGL
ncbi:MAG: hypothetical protein IKR59_04290, partial [Lachnospiraceae bacterium]|nr:hypothetical protein [Lachnospiraceae bacterium]